MMYKGILQTTEIRIVLRPFLQATTTALVILGLLGGWAGSNWLAVLVIVMVMMILIFWTGRLSRLRGAKSGYVYASAVINLTASAAIVIITGGVNSPFWLLFLVGALASALSFRGRAGENMELLNAAMAALALLGPELMNWPPRRPEIALAAMEVLTLFMTGRMIRKITSLLLESGEMLGQSEERYRKLIDHARDVIFTISKAGLITSLNPAFEAFTGWPRAEWLGHSFTNLVMEADRARALDQFNRVLHGETLRALRLHMPTYTGETLVVEMNISPQVKDGEVIGLLGIARDMTEEQRAEDTLKASERRFRALIEHGWDAFTLADAQGTIIYASPSTIRVLGYTPEEFVGLNAFTLFHPDDIAYARGKLLEVLQAPGNIITAEVRTRDKNGSWRWMEGVVTNLFGEPDVGALVTNYRDVTERKQAEELFYLAVESAPNAIILVDRAGQIVMVNSQVEKFFGYDRAELLGKPVDWLVPERFRAGHAIYHERFLANPQAHHMGAGRNLHCLRRDGSEFPAEIGLSPIETQMGLLVMATVVDITERMRAEEALRESEERYRTLAEAAQDMIFIISPTGTIEYLNEYAAQQFRHPPEELIGKPMAALFPPAVAARQLDNVQKVFNTGKPIYLENASTFGTRTVWLGTTLAPIKEQDGRTKAVLGVSRDITERKRAEEKLQQQNERLRALREIDTAILAADSTENIVSAALDYIRELIDCERANLALIEWEKNEAVNFDVKDSKESEISKGARVPLDLIQDILQVLSKNQPVIMDDLTTLPDPPPQIEIFIKEGLRSRCILPLFSQGHLIGSFTLSSKVPSYFDEEKINLGREVANQVAIAITQNNLLKTLRQLNAELEQRVHERTAELSEANALLQAMMENIPDHIYFKDIHSRFIRNSRAQAEMMGLNDPSEVVGKSDFDFFPHAQRAFDEEQEVMRSGQPLVDLEEYVVWPDGRVTWVSTTKAPLRDQEGKVIGIFGISRDITSRKQAEEALRKAKDEAETANKELDAFSYSVSHDLRAPLRAINGYAHLLMQDYAAQLPAEAQQYLENMLDGGQHMGHLIQDLLMLSRVSRQTLKHELVNLSDLAQAITSELSRAAPSRSAEFIIAKDLTAVGDAGLLQIVMENLLNNAWKYTSRRAQARIEFGALAPHQIPPNPENLWGEKEGGLVFFIRDNGAGFDMKYIDKLFGAFQRLHPESEFEGTGIGLATVQRIIQRHGGRIWAEAEVDKGATFYFTLGQ